MNTTLLRKARKVFKTFDAPPEIVRIYQLKWARSVHQLGDKWLLAKPVSKIL